MGLVRVDATQSVTREGRHGHAMSYGVSFLVWGIRPVVALSLVVVPLGGQQEQLYGGGSGVCVSGPPVFAQYGNGVPWNEIQRGEISVMLINNCS